LTLDDGTLVDSSRDRGEALPFVVGTGQVISGFDDAVRGAKVGDIIDATLQPEDAYGQYDPALVIDLPIAEGQEDVAVGDTVYLSNGQPVVVVAIADGVATVDTNHELAGKVLHFEVEIVSITRGEP
jgi:FKBP-type peptidyl-prolyl cis-trans isomerase 2